MVAADLALYEAKQAGRDRVVVHASTDVEVIERRARASWTQRIRTAIDDDLLVAYRQPIMDLDTRQVRQYELLVRMLDEDGTAIPPGAFLAVAERTGMILEIDRMMVAKAIALIAASEAAGDPISYEVNLSARSLADPLLPGVIARRVAESGIEPSLLVFEITETAAIANFDQARDFANALRRLGCRFALDDFGAGFASFFYLKHMPLDCLKIDGDFIRDLTQNRVDKIVVRHLAEIARELGMITIAEFVEDEATLELLVTYGIDHAQGYHIGRPEPVPAGADPVAFFAGLAIDRSEVAEEPLVASGAAAA
jgi:EAL domain-containing protein (putative c-di-GMP-specific phosphodiesterase class I)